jgi:dTDP-3-amino-2,3,6-trideoxy-4-keto-D-glucose/dTDP-3-amino-3,4,6-trideoxy-alpha-D-glucose/dTDP-2,6-dideoxy-D-kanosamine transaminase
VLLNDLSKKIANHRGAINVAIKRVLDSSWLVLGPEVKSFEKDFAKYMAVKYCHSVANGTDALELALRALGVKQDDRVATAANAGFYTSTALLAIGAVPFYLDVDLETRVVTINEVERAIREGVKAIVATHLYGQAVQDIVEIAERCHVAGVALVEDCAQAHGAKVDGKQAGSFGNIGCYSFYPTKNLGALGDGGAIVTNDEALSAKVTRLSQYGWSAKYHVEQTGARNSRLDAMQAAILSEFLPQLDSWNSRRREIASIYSTQINNPAVILPSDGDESYVAHLYVLRVSQRSSLQTHLRSYDITTDVHYPIPDHRQLIFGDRFASISLPNTEQLAKEVLSLPCYPEMTDDEVQQVISAVNGWQL